MTRYLLVLALILSVSKIYTQNPTAVLTPAEAVRLALESNYDIRLSRADADIARLNNTRANAGMLPTVNFVAGETSR